MADISVGFFLGWFKPVTTDILYNLRTIVKTHADKNTHLKAFISAFTAESTNRQVLPFISRF